MQLRDFDFFTRLLRARPLFTAALLFVCGCTLAYILQLSALCWIIPAVLILIAVVCFKRDHRMMCALLVLLMLPLGALRFDLAWQANAPLAEMSNVQLQGRIAEEPYYNAETERMICVLEEISINGEAVRGRIRLYLRGDTDLLHNVQLKQDIDCIAKVWQGDDASNPYQFSFGDYLRRNRLRGYATAKIEETSLIPREYKLSDVNDRLCGSISERIDMLFPRSSAIVKAFILGDRSEMTIADRDSFNRAGVAHLLAISGMHISALAMLVTWLFGRIFKQKYSFTVTMLLLLGYGWLIGFSPSLLRAILVFGIFNLGRVIGRYSDAPTRLAAAALFHLMIAPMDVLSASFILSYAASAGIVFLSTPLSRLLHLDAILNSASGRGFKSLLTSSLPQWFARSIITSLAAQIAVFPAVVHFFGAQPFWTLLTNLIAVPLAMLSYVFSLIALLSGLPGICTLPDLLFNLLSGFVRIVSQLPLSAIRIARFPIWLSLICAVTVLLSSDLCRISEKVRRFMPLSIFPAVIISSLLSMASLQGTSIVFMDAGQADCAVIRTEGKVYLVDTGDSYTPAADYLSAMNYNVDGIFLSHLHADHAGGLDSILDVCIPETIYLPANYDQVEIDESICASLEKAEQLGSEIRTLQTGDSIQLSRKSFAKVLAPDAGILMNSANEDSMILHVSCGDASALFTGDMPAYAMPEDLPDVDILKVAHHGAADSVDPRTLTQLTPSAAIIPVGEGNLFGHPTQDTLDLLSASGAKIYRSDFCGAITAELSADGSIAISTYKDFGGSE